MADYFVEFKTFLVNHGLEFFNKYYGHYKGFVSDNEDPDFRGRLKVRVPQIYGEEIPEYWALSKGMYLGKQIGMFAIPNVGDPIWITFENGDSRFPIWEYGWWGKDDYIRAAKNNGNKPTNQVWQSTTGQRIELDDKDKLMRIRQSDGYIVELSGTGIKVGNETGTFEPMLLGKKWKDLMTDFLNAIKHMTMGTNNGPSTTPINFAEFDSLIARLQNILSDDNDLT